MHVDSARGLPLSTRCHPFSESTEWRKKNKNGRLSKIALRYRSERNLLDIFNETCRTCGGLVGVIACIEGPMVISWTLSHLDEKGASEESFRLAPSWEPPRREFLTDRASKTSGCDKRRRTTAWMQQVEQRIE